MIKDYNVVIQLGKKIAYLILFYFRVFSKDEEGCIPAEEIK